MSNFSFNYNTLDDALPGVMASVMRGEEVGSRNGRVMELTHVALALGQPWKREITVPGRKANLAAQIAETMWVLAGRNDIGFLSHYLPRAADFSDDGETWRGGYGPRIRAWKNHDPNYIGMDEIDQLAHVVDLLKRDALTRRAVISIYDPAVDTADGKDIPCNDFITFTNRGGYLDMAVTIRSNDLMWGWSGINAFEWSALHEIIAKLVGVKQGTLHFNTASLHLYSQHWAKAQRLVGEQGARGLEDSPNFMPLRAVNQKPESVLTVEHLDSLIDRWFSLEESIRVGQRAVDDLVDEFPEPMMQSWLRVIQWWWTGDHAYLKPLAGTRLEYATHVAMQPPARGGLRKQAEEFCTDLVTQGRADEVRRALSHLGFSSVSAVPDDRLQEFSELFQGGLEAMERAIREKERSPREGSPCPKCGTVMTTSGGRTALKCIAAVCNYTPSTDDVSPFMREVVALHTEKEAAYGGSWKRRGEVLGILANIARKIDRLGTGGETADETSTDTAVDLMVYLMKYAAWLRDEMDGSNLSDGSGGVNDMLLVLDRNCHGLHASATIKEESALLADGFTKLEAMVLGPNPASLPNRYRLVVSMAQGAYLLARDLWRPDQDPTSTVDPDYRGADAD